MSWFDILKIKKFDEGIFKQFEDFIDEQYMQRPSSSILIYIKPDNEMNHSWESGAKFAEETGSVTESDLVITVKQSVVDSISSNPMEVFNAIGNEYRNNGFSYNKTTVNGKYKGIQLNQKKAHPTLAEYGGAGRAIRIGG
tara:strand:- start:52 stop:471 length:420 start_codon:yes stop_codon:yes gene_type:complete